MVGNENERKSAAGSAAEKAPERVAESVAGKDQRRSAESAVSRRGFIATMAAAGAVVAGGMLSGCASGESQGASGLADTSASWMPATWDAEADIVIAGFGAAGGACAIESADAGASVIILEKAPEVDAGGDTSVCGGMISSAGSLGSGSTVEGLRYSSLGLLSEEDAEAYLEVISTVDDWCEGIGIPVDFDSFPGSVITEGTMMASGYVFYEHLKQAVLDRSDAIEVRYETPAFGLVQDPVTGEVLGFKAGSADSPLFVKAKKACVLACAGYEADPGLANRLHASGLTLPTVGSPYNTGDGIKMAMAAGAKVENTGMAMEYAGLTCKAASEEYGTGIMLGGGSSELAQNYVIVNRWGQRFMNEGDALSHQKRALEILRMQGFDTDYLGTDLGYINLPAWIIFDDTGMKNSRFGRTHGPFASGWNCGNPELHHLYEWSEDNQAELERGWIVQADTLEELAAKCTSTDVIGRAIQLDGAGLAKEITEYNQMVTDGKDTKFGRGDAGGSAFFASGAQLAEIATPPFYAMEVTLSTIYSIGGPSININAQTVDWNDEPIPRLYQAGNIGSFDIFRSPGMSGCTSWGRIAAKNAVQLEPWDAEA